MSRRLSRTLLAFIALASVAGATRARANPVDLVGFGARGTGRAGAMVGAADALSAPIYNPAAGVLGTGEYELGLGYTYAHLAIDISGQDANTLPVRGFYFAGALPFDLGPAHLAVNVAAYIPDQFLLRAHAVPATEHRLVLWDNRPHRLVVNTTVAAQLCPWLAVGVGVSILGAVEGQRVDFTLDASPTQTRAESALSIDFPIIATPTVGIMLTPSPELRLGMRFTDEIGMNVTLNVLADVSVPGTPVDGTVDFRFRAPSGFMPREVVIGGSYDLGRWTLSAEFAWQQWSRVNQLTALIDVAVDLGAPVPTSSFVEPNPNLRDTITPRLAVEYALPLSDHRELRLRGGYAFAPSPIPAQRGITNYADGDRHVGAVGGSYGFRIFGVDAALDAAFQLQYMRETTSIKDDPTSPGGDLRVGGPITVFSLGARISL